MNQYFKQAMTASKQFYYEILKSNISNVHSLNHGTKLAKERFTELADAISTWTGQISGVRKLENMKENVVVAYKQLQDAKMSLKSSKTKYFTHVEIRRSTQATVNDLLQRKNTWNSKDVELFTKAVSDEHTFEQNEKSMKQDLLDLEALVERLQDGYDNKVQERYQEELLVAERNRGVSNLLTWSLMFANLAMFTISQLIIEPRRQRKARENVFQEIKNATDPINNEMSNITTLLAALSEEIKEDMKEVNQSTKETQDRIIKLNDRLKESQQINISHDSSFQKNGMKKKEATIAPEKPYLEPKESISDKTTIIQFDELVGQRQLLAVFYFFGFVTVTSLFKQSK